MNICRILGIDLRRYITVYNVKTVNVDNIILEDGFNIRLETGGLILLE